MASKQGGKYLLTASKDYLNLSHLGAGSEMKIRLRKQDGYKDATRSCTRLSKAGTLHTTGRNVG